MKLKSILLIAALLALSARAQESCSNPFFMCDAIVQGGIVLPGLEPNCQAPEDRFIMIKGDEAYFQNDVLTFESDIPFTIRILDMGATYEDVCSRYNSGNYTQVVSQFNVLNASMNFTNPSNYFLGIVTYTDCDQQITVSTTSQEPILACSPSSSPCESCLPLFSPKPGRYVISAWVSQDNMDPGTKNLDNPQIVIQLSPSNITYILNAEGNIIDDWQKIEEVIIIPTGTTHMDVKLGCEGEPDCYFDDIRFFPYDGSMLTYVYDSETYRLVAELDERNYATFYEYDEEGKLMRIKKETEKGIMTIQENRQSIIKQ